MHRAIPALYPRLQRRKRRGLKRHDTTRAGREDEGELSVQAPETSDWLWQFKSCERGGGVATPGDLIAPCILAAARLESPRARASIISGKFQTGSRGLAPAEAAGKSVNVGGSFEKEPPPFPSLSLRLKMKSVCEAKGTVRRDGRDVEIGFQFFQSNLKQRYHRNFPFLKRLYYISGRHHRSGPQVVTPFKPVKFFHSKSNDSYQICI